MKRIIVLVVATVFFVLGMGSPVNASDGPTPAPPTPKDGCVYTTDITAYAHIGNDMGEVLGEVDWSNKIREHKCRTKTRDGYTIRYMRANGDTAGEYSELLNFINSSDRKYPMVLCGDEAKSWMIDLTYYYFNNVRKISRSEHKGYAAWARDYAERRPDCSLYLGS